MALKGIFMSHQGIVGDRVGDFANAILQLFPTGNAQFFAISSGIPDEGAGDTTFHWYEDSHISGRQAITAGGTTTTVSVADGSFYIPNQILLVEETGEYLFVTAVVNNDLTVVRGMGGTTVTSVNNTMHVQLIGNAHEEASEKPTAVSQQGAPRNNLVQIFRNAWAISGTAKAVKFRHGDKLAKNKRECAMYHSEDIERSLIWGVKHVGVLNGNQFRLTEGILTQIENFGGIVESAASGSTAGNLDSDDLDDFIRRVFAINVKGQPNERIVYNGDIALATLNRIARANADYTMTQGETAYGINVTKYVTQFGTLNLMNHPMMSENPVWAKEMYVLHPGGLKKRTLRSTFEDNYDKSGTRTNGKDADEGLMTTEMGVQVGAARTMGIMRNVARGVATDFTA